MSYLTLRLKFFVIIVTFVYYSSNSIKLLFKLVNRRVSKDIVKENWETLNFLSMRY